MGRAFGEVVGYAQRERIQLVGPPFSLYNSLSDEGFEAETGSPVAKIENREGNVKPSGLPAGNVAMATHIGRDEDLRKTYSIPKKWIKANSYEPSSFDLEPYPNIPQEVAPDKLITQIFLPIK